MELSLQLLFNIACAIAGALGAWVLNRVFKQVDDLHDDIKEQAAITDKKIEEVREKHAQLALSLPTNYVPKHDFERLVENLNERFDRFERKLDQLKPSE